MTRNIWIDRREFRGRRGVAMAMFRGRLRSLWDRGFCARGVRGCRYAQPPANGSHPFGMARAAQAGGLAAISRWLSEARATPPVAGRRMTRIPEGCQRRIAFASRMDEYPKKMGALWK